MRSQAIIRSPEIYASKNRNQLKSKLIDVTGEKLLLSMEIKKCVTVVQ
jgi:hypothetical protein